MMSSNAFILPALTQPSAPVLNGTDARGPAVCKSDQRSSSADENSSFSATLRQISDRQNGSKPKAAPAGKSGVASRRADARSPKPQKTTQTTEMAPDAKERDETPLSASSEKTASVHHLRQAFNWLACHLMNFPMTDDGPLSVQPVSDSDAGTDLLMFGDWIEQLQSQGQAVLGDLVGIGPFEQMQANISPEAANWVLFEQLVLQVAALQGDGSQPVTLVEAGTLSNQTESSGVNGNPLLNTQPPLPEMAELNPDLLKTAASSQTTESGLSDGVKIAVADSNGSLPFSTPADADSETTLAAHARHMNGNLQPSKIQADLHMAAEQPASANSIVEGFIAKAPEEAFGLKSAASKFGSALGDGPGNKSVQIDGENKDSGLLFSQDQMSPHLTKVENAVHSVEAAQRSLNPQTLDQIVQKAVLSFNNGQHEVQIDLKPDLLGHIRMHIISEGHQVAIKIVAELPFVKDMLENNLHQLKTELQAQGLNINELEVSVAHDSRGEGDTRQTAKAAKVQAVRGHTDLDEGPFEKQSQTRFQSGDTTAVTAVDYFA